MKAILCDSGEGSRLENVSVPTISDQEVLIAVEACGLCGTDLLKISKKTDSAVLGHEIAGRVEEIGSRVRGLRPGDRIVAAHHVPCGHCHFCRHRNPSMCRQFKETNVFPGGFAEYLRLSALHVQSALLKIPDDLDPRWASQAEPLACCLRNARRLQIQEGDSVGIIGLGSIGQLTALALTRHFGASVLGLDVDLTRAAFLSGWALGFSDLKKFHQAALETTEGRGLDAVIFTAGNAEMVSQSSSWIRGGGILNIFASFNPDKVSLDLNDIYHRELTVMSSYSPALEDFAEALDLIASGKIPVEDIATQSYAIDNFKGAMEDLRSRKIVKAIIHPQS